MSKAEIDFAGPIIAAAAQVAKAVSARALFAYASALEELGTLRAAVKPTSSLPIEQDTVTSDGEPAKIRTRGRHDPCLLPRFVPMAEAMVAIVLADHWLRWRSQCGAEWRDEE